MATPPAAVKVARLTLNMLTSAHREVSPYSFAQRAYDFMGGMWSASMDLAEVAGRDRATVLRWLASLNGPSGKFEMALPDYAGPFGGIAVNPTVATAASARSLTVATKLSPVPGWVGSIVADDMITIGGHLHVVTAATAPDGVGVQTLTIWPRLREAVIVGQAVEALVPYGSWALANSRNGYTADADLHWSQAIDLNEAI